MQTTIQQSATRNQDGTPRVAFGHRYLARSRMHDDGITRYVRRDLGRYTLTTSKASAWRFRSENDAWLALSVAACECEEMTTGCYDVERITL